MSSKHERKVAKVTRKRNAVARKVANLEAQILQYTRIRDEGKFELPGWLPQARARAAGQLASLETELEQLQAEGFVDRLEGMIHGDPPE